MKLNVNITNKKMTTDIVILKYSPKTLAEAKLEAKRLAQHNHSEGNITPIPSNWQLKGDEAYYFNERGYAVRFLSFIYAEAFKPRYVDFATIISSEQLEKRKSGRRSLLDKLLMR